MARTYFDVSRTFSNDAVVYPGDPPYGLSVLCEIGPGCPYRMQRFDGWTGHVLTHVDAPRHFHQDGATLDRIDLARWTGLSHVVAIDGDTIDAAVVRAVAMRPGDNVLFKTRHSGPFPGTAYDPRHVYVSRCGAEALVERGANLVGVDYLSVDRFGDGDYPAHRTLLGHGVLILEGADFASVAPGVYDLMAFPLKLEDGDGSPVRAVLAR